MALSAPAIGRHATLMPNLSWVEPADLPASSNTAPLIAACPDCAKAQRLPALRPGMIAACIRCGALLRRTTPASLEVALALGLSSAVLLALGSMLVLATVDEAGQTRIADLLSGPAALAQNGLWELSALVAFTTIAAPVLCLGLLLYTLIGLRLRTVPPGLRTAYAWRVRLRPWSMIEVFLVGYFVAYSKLGSLVHITPGAGFFALFGFMLVNCAIDVTLDHHAVWEAIDRRDPIHPPRAAARAHAVRPTPIGCHICRLACDPADHAAVCPRCGSALHRRKPDSLARTAALALSGLLLYVPANVFPVLTVIKFDQGSPSTILTGVWELLDADQIPLAIIVFLASVAVPVLKLLGLAALMALATNRWSGNLRPLSVLYRIVIAIGRWSMIDIFMESILSALVQFGNTASIKPGDGAIAFAAVVVLTMFAAESFDPRLIWDRAAS
jgi:paraquat-inducible protein A